VTGWVINRRVWSSEMLPHPLVRIDGEWWVFWGLIGCGVNKYGLGCEKSLTECCQKLKWDDKCWQTMEGLL